MHYKELEFATSPGTAVEALISINNQLRQPEAARGILIHARSTLNMDLKVGSPILPRPASPLEAPFTSVVQSAF